VNFAYYIPPIRLILAVLSRVTNKYSTVCCLCVFIHDYAGVQPRMYNFTIWSSFLFSSSFCYFVYFSRKKVHEIADFSKQRTTQKWRFITHGLLGQKRI